MESVRPQDPGVKAISSERRALPDLHVRAAGGSSLRPAHGRLRCRRQTGGKGHPDIGYRYREASRCPQSLGNGVRREPAADVTGARLPDFRRKNAQMISFTQRRRNTKARQAIAPRLRGNSSSPRPASRAQFGPDKETAVHATFLSKVAAPDRLVVV